MLSLKTGENKASFAEVKQALICNISAKCFLFKQAIGAVKRRLYRSLRQSESNNWVKLLRSTVDSLNSVHTPRLGYLCPKQVDLESQPFIRLAQKASMSKMTERQREELFPPLDDYAAQQEAIIQYDETKQPYKPGMYVLLDLPSKAMDKSFDS